MATGKAKIRDPKTGETWSSRGGSVSSASQPSDQAIQASKNTQAPESWTNPTKGDSSSTNKSPESLTSRVLKPVANAANRVLQPAADAIGGKIAEARDSAYNYYKNSGLRENIKKYSDTNTAVSSYDAFFRASYGGKLPDENEAPVTGIGNNKTSSAVDVISNPLISAGSAIQTFGRSHLDQYGAAGQLIRGGTTDIVGGTLVLGGAGLQSVFNVGQRLGSAAVTGRDLGDALTSEVNRGISYGWEAAGGLTYAAITEPAAVAGGFLIPPNLGAAAKIGKPIAQGKVATLGRKAVPLDLITDPRLADAGSAVFRREAGINPFYSEPTSILKNVETAASKFSNYYPGNSDLFPEGTTFGIHSAPRTLPKSLTVASGSSENPGLYIAPKASIAFTRIPQQKISVGLADFGLPSPKKTIRSIKETIRPDSASINYIGVSEIKNLPRGARFSDSAAGRFLYSDAADRTAAYQTSKLNKHFLGADHLAENEAVIPPRTILNRVDSSLKTRLSSSISIGNRKLFDFGVDVPINAYAPTGLSNRVATANTQTRIVSPVIQRANALKAAGTKAAIIKERPAVNVLNQGGVASQKVAEKILNRPQAAPRKNRRSNVKKPTPEPTRIYLSDPKSALVGPLSKPHRSQSAAAISESVLRPSSQSQSSSAFVPVSRTAGSSRISSVSNSVSKIVAPSSSAAPETFAVISSPKKSRKQDVETHNSKRILTNSKRQSKNEMRINFIVDPEDFGSGSKKKKRV